MAKKMSRDDVIKNLKFAEMEEGRSGLVTEYLAKNPEPKKEDKKSKEK